MNSGCNTIWQKSWPLRHCASIGHKGLFCESGKHQMVQVFRGNMTNHLQCRLLSVLRITALSVPHVPIYGFRGGVCQSSSLHTASNIDCYANTATFEHLTIDTDTNAGQQHQAATFACGLGDDWCRRRQLHCLGTSKTRDKRQPTFTAYQRFHLTSREDRAVLV